VTQAPAPGLRLAKRIVVAVVGGTVTLIGIALIVLPGPAFIVIPIGLSILATQFVWARRYLKKARELAARLKK
jgi:tellurite resistance protein TerC